MKLSDNMFSLIRRSGKRCASAISTLFTTCLTTVVLLSPNAAMAHNSDLVGPGHCPGYGDTWGWDEGHDDYIGKDPALNVLRKIENKKAGENRTTVNLTENPDGIKVKLTLQHKPDDNAWAFHHACEYTGGVYFTFDVEDQREHGGAIRDGADLGYVLNGRYYLHIPHGDREGTLTIPFVSPLPTETASKRVDISLRSGSSWGWNFQMSLFSDGSDNSNPNTRDSSRMNVLIEDERTAPPPVVALPHIEWCDATYLNNVKVNPAEVDEGEPYKLALCTRDPIPEELAVRVQGSVDRVAGERDDDHLFQFIFPADTTNVNKRAYGSPSGGGTGETITFSDDIIRKDGFADYRILAQDHSFTNDLNPDDTSVKRRIIVRNDDFPRITFFASNENNEGETTLNVGARIHAGAEWENAANAVASELAPSVMTNSDNVRFGTNVGYYDDLTPPYGDILFARKTLTSDDSKRGWRNNLPYLCPSGSIRTAEHPILSHKGWQHWKRRSSH